MFSELKSTALIINLEYISYIDGRFIRFKDGLEITIAGEDIDPLRKDIQAYNLLQAKGAMSTQRRSDYSVRPEVKDV